MIASEARALIGERLAPLSIDTFLRDVIGKRVHVDTESGSNTSRSFLGDDPKAEILARYKTHAPKLGAHAATPAGPKPAAREVADTDEFAALIVEYHRLGYTVRIPDAGALSTELARFLRALELLLAKPVMAEIFWSAEGLAAPVHYDDYDIIVVHLHGEKRWFVADEEPRLSNPWKQIGEPPPVIGKHHVFDLKPGDLLYCPRGTAHTVSSPSESLHLSIGFAQLTVRDAVQAALDHMADLDRPLREAAVENVDLAEQIRNAVRRLSERCGSDAFLRDALDQRASRTIAELTQLPPNFPTAPLNPQSRVRHAPEALAHVRETNGVVDFSQPGGHIPMHPGAAEGVRFVAETPAFRIADIPGAFADDVRLALVGRLIESGFLETVEG